MNSLKKWTISLFAVLLGLIFTAALIPYVYKDDLLAFLKHNVNKKIRANVQFSDASLTLLSTFPNLGVHIDSLSLTGTDDFSGVSLYKANTTSVLVSLPSLLGGGRIPEIVKLEMQDPEINIVILDSLRANYLIMKEDSTASATADWELKLSDYELNNARITYRDYTLPVYIQIKNFTHKGKGDFTQDIFDLETRSTADSVSVEYAGVPYLKDASAQLDAVININVPEDKYSFKENRFTLNALDGAFDGFVRFQKDDIFSEFSFNAPTQPFSHFLSLMPGAYTEAFEKVTSRGTASVSGTISGVYNETKRSLPGFQIQLSVKDGYAKYPGMPMDISDANAEVFIKTAKPDYSDLKIDISQFNIKFGENFLSGMLAVDHLMANQKMEGSLKAQINLASLTKVFPNISDKKLKGTLSSNLSFNATVADVIQEKYQRINFQGTAELTDLSLETKENPEISARSIKLLANPELSTLIAKDMYLGNSDLNATVSLRNPMAAFALKKEVIINVTASSNLLDLNEWMPASAKHSAGNTATPLPADQKLLEASTLTIKGDAKKINFRDLELSDVELNARLAANAVNLQQLSLKTGQSDIAINGNLTGAYDYLFANGIMSGNVAMKSRKLDLNPFMSQRTSEKTESSGTLQVPERIKLKLAASIDDLRYTQMEIRNVHAEVNIHRDSANINEIVADMFGGKLKLEGLYSSVNPQKPDFSLRLDLLKIPYADAISKIDMFSKLAPVAAYIQGIFNTTLVMSGALDENMSPDLSVLDASGYIETLKGSIRNFKPFNEIAGKLGMKSFQELQLEDTKNWFEIKDGYLELKEFSKKWGEVKTTISGKHGFGKEMEYHIGFAVPRSLLQKNTYTQLAESGLSILEKEAARLGLNISQGSEILINMKLGGYITRPTLKITSVSSGEGGIAEVTEAAIASKVEALKDSLQKEMVKRKEILKDTLSQKASRELEQAKRKAEKEVEKALDSLKSRARDEVMNKADSLGKGVIPDSLRKKAREVLDKKANEEVDKIKSKMKDFNPFKKKG